MCGTRDVGSKNERMSIVGGGVDDERNLRNGGGDTYCCWRLRGNCIALG